MDSGTAEVIQAWLVSRFSELLGIDPQQVDVKGAIRQLWYGVDGGGQPLR